MEDLKVTIHYIGNLKKPLGVTLPAHECANLIDAWTDNQAEYETEEGYCIDFDNVRSINLEI